MDFKTCKKCNYVKQIQFDRHLYNSLIQSSSKKFQSQRLLKLDNTTAGSKISLTYDALRELLEALAISKGYKIYNHECYTAFLKEILKESVMGDQFNKFRKIRNDINYYGKDVSAEDSKHIINDMAVFIETIKTKFFEHSFAK